MSIEYHEALARELAELGPAAVHEQAERRQVHQAQRMTLAQGVAAGWIGGAELTRVLRLDTSDGPFSPALCYTAAPPRRMDVWSSARIPAREAVDAARHKLSRSARAALRASGVWADGSSPAEAAKAIAAWKATA